MRIYTVHAPPAGSKSANDPSRFAFIKEGFCWPALFFPGLWLLSRRLWLVLLGFLVVSIAMGKLGESVDRPLAATLFVLALLLFAVEANGLRRWTLERNGWRLIGVAEGGRLRDAERRFFSTWIASGARLPSPLAPPTPPAPPAAPSAEAGQVVGLFPVAGGAS